MTIRFLDPSEFWRLKGLPMLPDTVDPTTCKVLIAEDEGQILGFLCLQLVPHLDPTWVHPAARKQGIASALWSEMQAYLDQVRLPAALCLITTPSVEQAAQALGLTKQPGVPYLWTRKD